MVWFNVDDTLAFHPKAIHAGNAAVGLWVRAGSWSTQTLTDGFIPRQIARSLGSIGQCKALVNAGLWVEVEGGYKFHEWDERQQTKEDVQARRKSERVRKAEQRKRKNVPPGHQPDVQQDTPQDTPQDSGRMSHRESNPESRQVSSSPLLSSPLPSSSSGYVGGISLVPTARENDPPPPHCDRHPGGTPDPCGACASARKRWVAWNLERDQRAADESAERIERERRVTRQAAADRAAAIGNCNLCDSHGYAGMTLCAHDPGEADRAKRGRALVDAVLSKPKSVAS